MLLFSSSAPDVHPRAAPASICRWPGAAALCRPIKFVYGVWMSRRGREWWIGHAPQQQCSSRTQHKHRNVFNLCRVGHLIGGQHGDNLQLRINPLKKNSCSAADDTSDRLFGFWNSSRLLSLDFQYLPHFIMDGSIQLISLSRLAKKSIFSAFRCPPAINYRPPRRCGARNL